MVVKSELNCATPLNICQGFNPDRFLRHNFTCQKETLISALSMKSLICKSCFVIMLYLYFIIVVMTMVVMVGWRLKACRVTGRSYTMFWTEWGTLRRSRAHASGPLWLRRTGSDFRLLWWALIPYITHQDLTQSIWKQLKCPRIC